METQKSWIVGDTWGGGQVASFDSKGEAQAWVAAQKNPDRYRVNERIQAERERGFWQGR